MADNQASAKPTPLGQALLDQLKRNKRNEQSVLSLDYFVAGVPPFQLFDTKLNELADILEGAKPKPLYSVPELSLIGLAAYFEAFCKDLFAALVNICPQLLEHLAEARDCQFSLVEVLHLLDGSQHHIGSILAEHYDWGSARSVNGLFQDLLTVSPFSKDEAKKYGEFLSDRNLLVHHGGVYTLKYATQNLPKDVLKDSAHWDSLKIEKVHVLEWIKFLREIAQKMARASHQAVTKYLKEKQVELDEQQKQAVWFLSPDAE
jgi:hypothetical protein